MTHTYTNLQDAIRYMALPANPKPRSRYAYQSFPYTSTPIPAPNPPNTPPYLPVRSFSPNPNQDPLDQFLQAKHTNRTRSIEDVEALIEQRDHLKQSNLYGILLNECQVLTKIHEMEHFDFAVNPLVEKRRATFEKELLDFDKQRRMEEVAAWKDTLTLKSDLRELLQELYKNQATHALTQP